MRIVIDMQGAQTESRFRGIGRYTMSFAKAIIRNRGEHEIFLVLNGLFPDTIEPIRAAFYGHLPQENIRVWYTPSPVLEALPGNTWRRKTAELIREAFLASLKPDVIHITSLFEGYVDNAVTSIGLFNQIPTSVTLYDLIPLLNKDYYLHPNPAYEQYYLRKIDYLRRASLLLAISESSRHEGITHLGFPADRIVNVSASIEDHFKPILLDKEQKQIIQNKFGITHPFVLYTGGADERKNLPRLIRAYARLSTELRKTHQLVFAGSMPDSEITRLKQEAKSSGINIDDELIFTGYVADEELVKLYNLCKVFVFPSWHEGFGLPALEAMSCGCVVIGANTSSLPEVIGNKNALFNPFSVESITEKLTLVLTNEVFRKELARHGIEQAKLFSWDEIARRAILAFEKMYLSLSDHHAETALTSKLIKSIAALTPSDITDHDIINIALSIAKFQFDNREKQLFVDISELVQRDAKTGVQRVVRSILREWFKNPPKGLRVEPVYATPEQGYRYARQFTWKFLDLPKDMLFELSDDPIEFQVGDIFLGLDLQHHVVISQQAFYQQLRRDGVQVYFLVYDLLPILLPYAFPDGVAQLHQRWLEIVSQSDGAICISKAVADELTNWIEVHGTERLRPFKISWFHLGADVENSIPSYGMPDNAEDVLNTIRKRSSFLMVGTIEPRKGHAQTLSAFDLLWEQGIDINLVIVGKQGWMVEDLVERLRNHPELDKRLFWLDGISDEYLEKVYAASTCLIAASEGEGFGLPLIEAAQHKLPIIARDIPVFREVAGKNAFYFDGLSPDDLAHTIEKWLELYNKGKAPSSEGIKWLTWKESAMYLLQEVLK